MKLAVTGIHTAPSGLTGGREGEKEEDREKQESANKQEFLGAGGASPGARGAEPQSLQPRTQNSPQPTLAQPEADDWYRSPDPCLAFIPILSRASD